MSDNPSQRITELTNRLNNMGAAGSGAGAATADLHAKKDLAKAQRQINDEIRLIEGANNSAQT